MRPLVFPLFFLSPLNSPFSGLYSFALSWSHDCIQPTPVFLLFHLIFFYGSCTCNKTKYLTLQEASTGWTEKKTFLIMEICSPEKMEKNHVYHACGYHFFHAWITSSSVVTTFFIKLLAFWLQESVRDNTHSGDIFKSSDVPTCQYTQCSRFRFLR